MCVRVCFFFCPFVFRIVRLTKVCLTSSPGFFAIQNGGERHPGNLIVDRVTPNTLEILIKIQHSRRPAIDQIVGLGLPYPVRPL